MINHTNNFEIAPGKYVDQYKILREIGRGGMGVIYLAEQHGVGRIVALKIMIKDYVENEVQEKRFLMEAQVISQMNHPNIIQVYGMGIFNRCPYFTMNYVEGGTFEDVIERNDLSLNDKLQIFSQICSAMDWVHQKNIVHRDLKPSNVLLDKNLNPYVSDFGLVRVLDSKTVLTMTGGVVGTAYYMSPEQVEGHRDEIDNKSDIYSLGVMLYQTLTEELPFQAETFPILARKITTGVFDFPSEKAIPEPLQAICRCAMAKDKHLRYETANELAQDLHNYHNNRATLAEDVLGQASSSKLMKKLVAVVWGIIIIVALSWWFTRPTLSQKSNLNNLLKQAQLAIKNKQNVEAITLLEKFLSHKPNHSKVLQKCEQLIVGSKNIDQLRFFWARQVGHSKTNLKTVRYVAKRSFEQGFFNDSVGYWQKVLAKKSSDLEANQFLGRIYLIQNNFAQARQHYAKISNKTTTATLDWLEIQLFLGQKKLIRELENLPIPRRKVLSKNVISF